MKLGGKINLFPSTTIPPVSEIIYKHVVELGKRAVESESLREDVVGEYEFGLVLLQMLGERVEGEDLELVKGLKEKFQVMYEKAKEKKII